MQRLDRILSEAGAGSRKELRTAIRAGRVRVDGQTVTDESMKFGDSAQITLDGDPVERLRPVLLMLHKPAGYVTSTDDPSGPTVMELIPERYRRLGVMPAGRLDKATEGLLLLTNDGELAHRIISPRRGVWKTYYAEHTGQAAQADVDAFAGGLTLSDGTECLPAVLVPQGQGRSLVRIREGKYHQVRRMLASRGMPVSYLKRLAEGALTLGTLPKGEITELSIAEAERLMAENTEFFGETDTES